MKYIIHRGLTSNKNKENSYLAIRNAILDKNSSGVEFDIRLTKDNKIVLSHDSIIGINYIENMDYIDIIKYKYLTTLDRILSINTDKILPLVSLGAIIVPLAFVYAGLLGSLVLKYSLMYVEPPNFSSPTVVIKLMLFKLISSFLA